MEHISDLSYETVRTVVKTLDDHNGNYKKSASKLKMDVQLVKDIDIIHNKKYNATIQGNGRPELEKYIVAKNPAGQQWDLNDPAIIKAREDYDNGKVELVTGRDGLTFILYAIPRKVQAVRAKPYFELEEE